MLDMVQQASALAGVALTFGILGAWLAYAWWFFGFFFGLAALFFGVLALTSAQSLRARGIALRSTMAKIALVLGVIAIVISSVSPNDTEIM